MKKILAALGFILFTSCSTAVPTPTPAPAVEVKPQPVKVEKAEKKEKTKLELLCQAGVVLGMYGEEGAKKDGEDITIKVVSCFITTASGKEIGILIHEIFTNDGPPRPVLMLTEMKFEDKRWEVGDEEPYAIFAYGAEKILKDSTL